MPDEREQTQLQMQMLQVQLNEAQRCNKVADDVLALKNFKIKILVHSLSEKTGIPPKQVYEELDAKILKYRREHPGVLPEERQAIEIPKGIKL